jgi:hypothetical protein
MLDYILLMHNDAVTQITPEMWPPYLSFLKRKGIFEGGSAIGAGEVFREKWAPGDLSAHIGGYLRIQAESLADARELLAGNPVYQCGGTVEIRELPRG